MIKFDLCKLRGVGDRVLAIVSCQSCLVRTGFAVLAPILANSTAKVAISFETRNKKAENFHPRLYFFSIKGGLKAQKHLAQGIALGNIGINQCRPERAKASYILCFCPFRATLIVCLYTQGVALGYVLLPFLGDFDCLLIYPGRCPGLCAFALSGRLCLPIYPGRIK